MYMRVCISYSVFCILYFVLCILYSVLYVVGGGGEGWLVEQSEFTMSRSTPLFHPTHTNAHTAAAKQWGGRGGGSPPHIQPFVQNNLEINSYMKSK